MSRYRREKINACNKLFENSPILKISCHIEISKITDYSSHVLNNKKHKQILYQYYDFGVRVFLTNKYIYKFLSIPGIETVCKRVKTLKVSLSFKHGQFIITT